MSCTDNIVISGLIINMLGPPDYYRYIGVIVISGFFPIHRYTGNIVVSRIVISGFHCTASCTVVLC